MKDWLVMLSLLLLTANTNVGIGTDRCFFLISAGVGAVTAVDRWYRYGPALFLMPAGVGR